MPLGDHRIAGGDRGSKVPATDTVECEWEIVRPEDADRTNRREAGANVCFDIDRRQRPRSVARGRGGLAKLVRCPGQLNLRQAGRDRQCRLEMSQLNDRVAAGIDPLGGAIEKLSDLVTGHASQPIGRDDRRIQRRIAVAPRTHRIRVRERFARGRILGSKCARDVRLTPSAIDQDWLQLHR